MALDEDINRPDEVPETTPIPEPGRLLMLLAGCGGLGVLHWLRRSGSRPDERSNK